MKTVQESRRPKLWAKILLSKYRVGDLAEIYGCSPGVMSNKIHKNKNITLSDLKWFADTLQCDIIELI